MRYKFIDTDEEYKQVLFELGQLDPLDDWPMFKMQDKKDFDLMVEIGEEVWCRYVLGQC